MNKNLPSIGQIATSVKTYNKEDVDMFCKLSGDMNPIHIDEKYAEKTIFKRIIVNGPFVSSQISEILGNNLPGPGSILVHQSFNFILPVYVGDTITCEVEVISIKESKNIIELKTTCFNSDKKIVINGISIIKKL